MTEQAVPAPENRPGFLEPGLVLGDRFVATSIGGEMEHFNPATGRVNKAFPVATLDEVDEAVSAARAAFEEWRRWTPDARRAALLRLADIMVERRREIGVIAALESGTIYNEFVAAYTADWFRYYAGWADKLTGESINPYPFRGLDFTVPEPVGVVALFVASNGPIGFFGMAGAPALAAGCTLVVKPPELGPFSSVSFARWCLEAGIPPGVVNVVGGGPEVSQALVRHPGVDKISFTGSTQTGRRLQEAAAQNVKPLVMELGGKSANIVFADADLDAVIPGAARFINSAGQGCSMPTRLLVQRPRYDRAIEEVARIASGVVAGDPFTPGVTMGPVISESSARRITGLVSDAKESGAARVHQGGGRIGGELANGYFVEPTLLVDVDNAAPIAQTEIFGPVLCVIPFDDEDEAIALANGTGFGLVAYAHTQDMRRARRLIDSLRAGSVHINSSGPGPVSPASPFGGVKDSGYGRQGSRLGIEEFLSYKNVYLNI
ncbi:aldehyde dehydrogenase (NAD+) [Parafrankia irregularis]|uniref:Aldehyde dehydrogenase (NAD+) n=1 Tax=Parafrankia irregularis TaxID=795642 RepID=A0A0S4QNM4_9ACTN|nr:MULTISPECIES: aldehyde dehydrogenase family protein [Parafrankia]MBE3200154.1 aldehyde dehydrogenase [Parafrankia sp. CH37]CUU56654.1 aldehyde dehydrogenase (NAD+) [Parafrankia irregularis]